MKASETTLRPVLDGGKQFMVPFFQRTYAWRKKDWQSLWSDLLETYTSDSPRPLFLGSMVMKPYDSTPEGVARFVLIDGQQRLTTLTILLAALRDTARTKNLDKIADRLHGLYLTNKYADDFLAFKVLPTQADRMAYAAIISGECNVDSQLLDAYNYFRNQLIDEDETETSVDISGLEKCILDSIEVVSITLAQDDNEYRIFESLNAKGVALSQADLLRNYFFMRIPLERHDEVYSKIWLPMQQGISGARGHERDLEAFLRYELMSRGVFVRESDVYADWTSKLDAEASHPDDLERAMLHLSRRARFFQSLVSPGLEPNRRISEGLTRLNRWGGQTMYPFLLFVYDSYDRQETTADGFVRILNTIESFLVRRLFSRVPTNALNRLFATLSKDMPTGTDLSEPVRQVLAQAGKRWPGDAEFVANIISYPLYSDSRPDQRKLVLESLERSFGFKEAISDFREYSIEHVMPQGLTDEWREALGNEWRSIHEQYLHTVGNLTLTKYNQELSNLPFARPAEPLEIQPAEKPRTKRQWLHLSKVSLNNEIAKELRWSQDEIVARGKQLAERALILWPGPQD